MTPSFIRSTEYTTEWRRAARHLKLVNFLDAENEAAAAGIRATFEDSVANLDHNGRRQIAPGASDLDDVTEGR
jgi:hypothetical protein